MKHGITKTNKAFSSSPNNQESGEKKTPAQDAGKDRQARLDIALRANLRKRKQQARARRDKNDAHKR